MGIAPSLRMLCPFPNINVNDNTFAGAIVINLDRRPDRYAQFHRLYNDTLCDPRPPLYRLSAFDAKMLMSHTQTARLLTHAAQREILEATRTHHSQLTVGAIGCYLSHIQAWTRVAQWGAAAPEIPWLIFEDDAILPPSFMMPVWRMHNAYARARSHQHENQILFTSLSAKSQVTSASISNSKQHENRVHVPGLAFGLAAYALTPRAASQLLALSAPSLFPIDTQLDVFLSTHPRVFFAMPLAHNPIRARGGKSDIQNSVRVPGKLLR